MSTPAQDTPISAVDIVVARPERAAALRELSAALARLGDDALWAARSSADVRLHVVACQAQHLAGDVWALAPGDDGTDDPPQEGDGLTSSVAMAQQALQGPDIHPLPPALERSLSWLLQLAEAVTS